MNFTGVVIEESLKDKSVLDKVKILKTKEEPVTEGDKTPWLDKWTLHTIEVPENYADEFAEEVSRALETDHTSWYADFNNDATHYIIFADKIFKIDRTKKKQYREASDHGIALGIPPYQVDFTTLTIS